jgi:uncharacterized protein (TIGR03086 family)
MSTEALQTAIGTTRGVLSEIRPDQLSLPTPCASWTVADVINHVVGGQQLFAKMLRGEEVSRDPVDYASGDFMAAFDEGSAASLAEFEAEGVMDRIVHLPFGDMPGSAFMAIATTDTLTHGWDLAKATGQGTDLSPELAEQLLAGVQGFLSDKMRGADGVAAFGPEQSAPTDASNADRLAAFLGRSV